MSGKRLRSLRQPLPDARPPGEARNGKHPNEPGLRAFVTAAGDGLEARESRKKRSEPTAKVLVYFPVAIEHALRLAALREKRSLSDAVTEAVTRWLVEHGSHP